MHSSYICRHIQRGCETHTCALARTYIHTYPLHIHIKTYTHRVRVSVCLPVFRISAGMCKISHTAAHINTHLQNTFATIICNAHLQHTFATHTATHTATPTAAHTHHSARLLHIYACVYVYICTFIYSIHRYISYIHMTSHDFFIGVSLYLHIDTAHRI